jgi:hypothetical protein
MYTKYQYVNLTIKIKNMKRVLLLALFLLWINGLQAQRLSRAYIGAVLHDNEIGLSLTNSFGINQYLGLGAGVDVTSYKSQLLVPFYADVRIKYPVNSLAPFIFGQGGKQLYNKDISYQDITGAAGKTKIIGKYFFGAGIGISYMPSKVGFFASYTQRWYKFKYKDEPMINGHPILEDPNKSLGAITAGLIF